MSTANCGSLGNRSFPISFFINQSALQALEWEQCPRNGSSFMLFPVLWVAFVHMQASGVGLCRAWVLREKKKPSCLDMEYEMSSNALNPQVVCKYEVATLRLMSVGARSLSGRLQLCPSSYTLAYLPWIPCNCSRKKKERLFRRRSHACLRACATSNNNNKVISFFWRSLLVSPQSPLTRSVFPFFFSFLFHPSSASSAHSWQGYG